MGRKYNFIIKKKITLVSCFGTWVIKILSHIRPWLFPKDKCEDVFLFQYRVMVKGYSSDCVIAFILENEKSMNKRNL